MRHMFFAIALTASLSASPVFAGETPNNTAVSDPNHAIKCRKVEVTGSLVKKGRVCKTIAEWKRLQQLGNDAARAIAGEHVCAGGECRGFEPPPNGQ